MELLASLEFVSKGQNLSITESFGTDKSYLATALGYQAYKIRSIYLLCQRPNCWVRSRRKALRTPRGRFKENRAVSLLILDDLFLVPMDAKERPLLLDIIEDRHVCKSIIVTSQLYVSDW